MQDPLNDHGVFATEHAGRYLQQLCKHFGHKAETTFDDTTGRIVFPFATVELAATALQLDVRAEARDPDDLARARRVIDNHLARFAFREAFEGMAWDCRIPDRV